MSTDGGAYFALINRISTEMEPLVENGSTPAWLSQIYQFQAMKAQGLSQQTGVAGKATETGKNLLNTVEKKLGTDIGGKKLEQQIIAGQAFAAYRNSLAAIAPFITRSQAYQLTAQTFSEDAATGKSPVYAGYAAIERMKPGFSDGNPDAVVMALISGPLDFLWNYMRKETSAYLDTQWNETVLAPVSGMSLQQATQVLSGPEGETTKVWAIAETDATRNSRNCRIRPCSPAGPGHRNRGLRFPKRPVTFSRARPSL